jgi:HEAT repeat protein
MAQASKPPLSNAGPVLEKLGQQLQDTSLPEADRVDLANLLGQWGTPQVREPLLAVIRDPHASIRAAAARALGWPGNREAAAALRERVEAADETPEVKVIALESLDKIGDDSVREAVLAATNDADHRVRRAAFGGLTIGSFARAEDRIALMRRVAGDQALEPWLRCEAIRVLGDANDTASIPLLVRLLESERPLRMMPPRRGATQQEIVAIRHWQARDVRAWAASSLGLLEAREALPLLLKGAEDPDDFFLRMNAIRALVAWGAPEALPVLERRLGDPVADVRLMALDGIAKAGDRSAVEAVRGRLIDPEAEVRLQAVEAVVRLGDQGARAGLEELRLKDPDPRVQQAAEGALGRLPR